MKFSDIYKQILDNQNVFLTGEAGTGKTYNLKKIIKKLKEDGHKRIITATTGIAANHINAMTIHRVMGFGIQDSVEYIPYIFKKSWWPKTERTLRNTEFMIIDEISMMSPKQFKLVDLILKRIRNNNKPFGGVRMIFVGDFLQLPPIRKNEGQIFETQEWKDANPFPIILKEIRRTNNEELIFILSKIRKGIYDLDVIDFMKRVSKNKVENPIKILSTNREVDQINNYELNNLKSELKLVKAHYEIKVEKNKEQVENMVRDFFKNSLVDEEYYLKVGARIMFVRNQDSLNIFNGELGVVVGWSEHNQPIVKLDHGKIVIVHKRDMEITNSKDEVLAIIWQQPLKLAYAITVHKTQGMTIPKIEIDANNFFATGQLYVALSRASNINGIKIKNISSKKLLVNKNALKYYDKIENLF